MSNLQRMANASYGIEKYLRSKGLKSNTAFVSKITAKFLKSKGLPYTNYNPRYKGLFTANICNAVSVQENFEEFKQFVEETIINSKDKQENCEISS